MKRATNISTGGLWRQGSRSLRRRSLVAGAGLAGLAVLGAGCGSSGHGTTASTTSKASTSATTTAAPPGGTSGAAGLQQAFVSVVNQVRPEVVEVTSTSNGVESLGSGVVYDAKGDIVTNAHVVADATTFQVLFEDGKTANATLVGRYVAGDLAVIKVSGSAQDLHPATFGNSKALQIGDIVLAIGNPLGFSSSVTEGIVSFNGRSVQESSTVTLPSTVQTSAAINPGNSGGALVDLSGDVIGIPTLAATDQSQGGGAAAGIGFAIPSDTVKLIAPQLIQSGKVTNTGRAEIGVLASPSTGPSGQPNGVVIVSVTAGGPAAKAGIPAGAIITAVNGQAVQTLADLQDALAQLTPGQTAKITYKANGSTKTATVALGQLPGGG